MPRTEPAKSIKSIEIPSGLRVLIAEDEDAFRLRLFDLLQKEGCVVTAASNGREAQHLFPLDTFDLVISDISMPGMDGHGLLDFIKKRSSTKVILMTGYAYPEGASACVPDKLLLKPFRKEELLAAMAESLGSLPRKLWLRPEEVQAFSPKSPELQDRPPGSDLLIALDDGSYEVLCTNTEPVPVKKTNALLRLGVQLWVRRQKAA